MKLFKLTIFLVALCLVGFFQQNTHTPSPLASVPNQGTPVEEIALMEKHFHAGHDHSNDDVHEIRMGDHRFCTVQPSPYPTTMTQPNGNQLSVYIKGNSKIYYLETPDGFTVVKDNSDNYYKYAESNANGDLIPSSVIANNIGARTSAEDLYLTNGEKGIKYTGATLANLQSQQLQNGPNLSPGASSPQGVFPSTGNRKALLILIDYPDQLATYPTTAFDSMTNTVGYNVNGQAGSFRDYYFDASNGQLTLTTDIAGWYTADSNRAVYGRGSINGAKPLVLQAIAAAEAAGTDFSQYDGDGDGAVDVVMIIHSGRGMEETGDDGDIWSHRSGLGSSSVTYDGVTVNDYIVQPEALWSSYQIANIGVLCHEFGHALGLPDLYDTDASNGGSAGLRKWGIMAGGTWNNGGATPGYFSAWCKEQLGWVVPTVLNGSGSISNMPSKTASYRINTPDANEYFLLETREQKEWDLYMPGEGLAIYHIISNGWNGDETRKKVDLESADGLTEMDDQVNSGNQADMFPSGINNSFDDNSNPNMLLHNGTITGSSISNIAHNNHLVSFNYAKKLSKYKKILSKSEQIFVFFTIFTKLWSLNNL